MYDSHPGPTLSIFHHPLRYYNIVHIYIYDQYPLIIHLKLPPGADEPLAISHPRSHLSTFEAYISYNFISIIDKQVFVYPIGRTVALIPDVRDGSAIEPMVSGIETFRSLVCFSAIVFVVLVTIATLDWNPIECLVFQTDPLGMVKSSHQLLVVVCMKTVYSGLNGIKILRLTQMKLHSRW